MKKWIFVFAAVAVHASGFAQPSEESAAERQRELIAAIETEQARNGPMSEGLIEPTMGLVLLYEELGDDGLAVVTTERALQLIRANYGIYSVEQAPILRRLMSRAEAHGDHLAAWEYDQQLLEIAVRNPDDLRSVPILTDIADARIDMLDRFLGGEFPPQIQLGCYFAGGMLNSNRSCSAGSQQRAARTILKEAHDAYAGAIDVYVAKERYDSDELRELEWDIIRSTLEHGRYLGGVREYCDGVGGDREYCGKYLRGSVGCRLVEDRLQRLHEYDVRSNAPLRQRVDSLVQIADWKLYCIGNAYAYSAYEAVIELLEKENAPQAEFDRLFAPDAPVLLPAFADTLLVTQAPTPTAAYVDIAFEVSRFGTTRSIKFISGKKTPGADDIERVIKRGRFRPFVEKGEFEDSPRFEVRYFVAN